MIRRPPRSTQSRSSAASDVYKRQPRRPPACGAVRSVTAGRTAVRAAWTVPVPAGVGTVSYTHLRAHETVLDLVCRLLLEKKKNHETKTMNTNTHTHELVDPTTRHDSTH